MRNNPKTAEEMYYDTQLDRMSYPDFLFKQNEGLRKAEERLQEQLDIAKTGLEFVKDVLVENKDSDVLWDMVNGYLKATLDKIEEVK